MCCLEERWSTHWCIWSSRSLQFRFYTSPRKSSISSSLITSISSKFWSASLGLPLTLDDATISLKDCLMAFRSSNSSSSKLSSSSLVSSSSWYLNMKCVKNLRLRSKDPMTYQVCTERGRDGASQKQMKYVKKVAQYLNSINGPKCSIKCRRVSSIIKCTRAWIL